MDCIVYGVAKSWIQLSDFHFHFHINLKSDGSEEHRMSKLYDKYFTPTHLAIILSYADNDFIIKILYVHKT